MDRIIIKGARQHNLKEIDLELPRDRLIVITGVSGSGKSSLAFDTIYAEGQRRYVESLSAYARQFLAQMDKPEVDFIEGLSPAISIDQKRRSHNPRSTVGTVTEIYDYLRLLFARIGKPHCYRCGRPITQQTSQQIIDRVLELPEGTKVQVLAPVVRGRKGEYRGLFEELRREGYTRARVDGEPHELDEEITLDKYKKHDIEVVVDRIVVRPNLRGRIADSVETALKLAEGNVIISIVDDEELFLSEQLACPECGVSYGKIEPRLFSFNSPYGACPECGGLGVKLEIDPELVIDRRKTLFDGGIIPWARSQSRWLQAMLSGLCREYRIDPDIPLGKLPEEQLDILLYGTDGEKVRFPYTNQAGRTRTFETVYRGVIPSLERQLRERQSEWAYEEIKQYMSTRPCPACGGKRLRPESL
ncbi:MAG: excinuclease ABC subunit UvrA, partial [Candidatus Bipolaricaulia bacterium]